MGKAESQSKHVPTTQLNSIEAKIDVILEDTSTTLEDKLDAIKLIVEAIPDFTTLEAKINEILEDTSITLEEKLDALNVLDVAIEDKLDNATYGLAALKVLIDALEGKLDHASHGLAALKTLIDAVEGKLDHPSHGLANLKTLIDAVEGKLDHASHGLAALKTLIDAIETKLDAWPAERGTDNAELETAALTRYNTLAAYVDEIESLLKNVTYGLSALKALIDAVEAKLDALPAERGTDNAELEADAATRYTALAGYVDEIESLLKDGTYGLSALETLVDEVESLLKNATYGLSALKTEIDANETKINRKVSCMTFLSVIDDVIDLPATAADTDLPNVVISGIPDGATLTKVLVFVKIRALENTSATGANAIQGAQNIRIKKSTGAWGVDDIIAIPLTDNMWTIAASTREFGDVIGGDDAHDVKSEVDENATYNLRFEDADVDYDYLRLNDVQVMIKMWFT